MIKYLGSKRTLVPVLGEIFSASKARTALDLFTGTTRVAQEFKLRGAQVTATDIATYSDILARCYIETDSRTVDELRLQQVLAELNSLPGQPGYFTATFCEASRFFQPKNGARIDAIREKLEAEFRDDRLYPILLTSLMLAADRVDSTTGVQMAYLKEWAPRAYNDLQLTVPKLLPGTGQSVCGDANQLVDQLPAVDLAYLDPPYNQHRYFTNYHIWESLVRWDKPEHYGVACKRVDAREDSTKSNFNRKREMPEALKSVIQRVQADTVVISYNNESWISAEEMQDTLATHHPSVATFAFDFKRYVGAQIGIYNPDGNKVGKVSHTRNIEYVFVAGPKSTVSRVKDALATASQVSLF